MKKYIIIDNKKFEISKLEKKLDLFNGEFSIFDIDDYLINKHKNNYDLDGKMKLKSEIVFDAIYENRIYKYNFHNCFIIDIFFEKNEVTIHYDYLELILK